ncbi:MAG: ABC transporter ATP-binding protein [Planctomycetes bacterium]|nr:ABC transporter ATP-binding protein [Planctomycetota bacterium]MBL7041871.1 ABC transporter ATP-binding protein [Pirellulaceae bacterium]
MIELEGVSKVFRTRNGDVRALDGVTLRVNDGGFVAIRGASGCGKSTLLSLVGGLALPTVGKITVAGNEVSGMSPAQRAEFRTDNIGFVFQMFHLLPYLTVLDNVLVAAPAGARSTAAERAKELLDTFSLSDRLLHRPGQLSVGQRQRVAMARALLNRPALLLADEPTGNLDPENAASLLDTMAAFHRDGGTILLVTHDSQAAERAGRILELDQGRVREGT